MNEFAEIGKIDGLETSCVMRKNNVGITLIMNDINTLKKFYPERWGDIEANTVSHFSMNEYGDITKISRNARLYNR
jgi:type IV secretory pathway TraG/TraD family ATPase VirD4